MNSSKSAILRTIDSGALGLGSSPLGSSPQTVSAQGALDGSRPDSRLDQEGAANPAGSHQVNTNSADFNNNADVNNFALNDGAVEDAAAIKEIQEDPEKLLFRQSSQLKVIIASGLH